MTAPRTARRALAAAASLAALPAGAQMAGVPVLQGAFPRHGLAVAVNYGGADDGTAIGGAASWGLAGERLAVTGGAGAFSADGYRSGALTYGVRAAFRAMTLADGRIAVTPFAGFGRVELRRARVAAGESDAAGEARAPAGVSVGFRRAMGARGALAFFAAPMYAFSRPDDGDAESGGFFRLAAGAEYGFTTGFGALGVTAGFEVGQSASGTRFGPRGGAFGLGVGLSRGSR